MVGTLIASLDIKKGLWSLDKVKDQADKEFAYLNEAYLHSTLPSQPDSGKIDELLIEIVDDFFKFQEGKGVYADKV